MNKFDYLKELGSRIRLKRVSLGLSQEDVANSLGYKDRSTIARIENGETDLSQTKIMRIAEVLQTTTLYLVDGIEALPQVEGKEPDSLGEIEEAIISMISKMSLEHKIEIYLECMKRQ